MAVRDWFRSERSYEEELIRIEKKVAKEKLNPSQGDIASHEGERESDQNVVQFTQYYETLSAVNRAINMIVDDCSQVQWNILESTSSRPRIQKKKLNRLISVEPNPFQDISVFKRNCYLDLLLDGNVFIYYDGTSLYHLPANRVKIVPDEKNFIKYFVFDNKVEYSPDEMFYIRDNSFKSIYRGTSRLKTIKSEMDLLTNLKSFQANFFNEGAVPGLVLECPSTLSDRLKNRLKLAWAREYRPKTGGRRPMILDGGMKLNSLSNINFRDLDFNNSVIELEKGIYKSLGIPPALIDGGNNANIRPNLRLYYLETVLPTVKKFNEALTHFFGFELEEDIASISAMQPELKELAQFATGLVNGGLISPNEGRREVGYDRFVLPEESDDMDEIRIPANIAGSAVDPNEGGRPNADDKE